MRSIRITPHMNFVFGKAIGSVGKSLKMLHGGDDFLLTYDEHGIGKEDLVPELMGGVLEDLFGSGRWRVKCTPQQNGKEKITYHVVGKGFARPFWWWYDGESPSEGMDDPFLEALKKAKEKRRYWLKSATRTDIQLHPNLDDPTLDDEEE